MFEMTFIIIFDQDGDTALSVAVHKELLEIIELLINSGAKTDQQYRVCKLFNILIINFILFIDDHC